MVSISPWKFMLHKHDIYTHTHIQAYYACYAYPVTPGCLFADRKSWPVAMMSVTRRTEVNQKKQKHLCCQNDVVAHYSHPCSTAYFSRSRFQRVLFTTIIGTSTGCTKIPTFDSFTLLFMHRSPRAAF